MKTTPAKLDTSEKAIKEFVRNILFRHGDYNTNGNRYHSRISLQEELIHKTKCTISDANNFLREMDELGLILCDEMFLGYDLQQFAGLRDFISIDEVKKINEAVDKAEYDLIKEEMKNDPEAKATYERLIYIYGPDKDKWDYEEYYQLCSEYGNDPRLWPRER